MPDPLHQVDPSHQVNDPLHQLNDSIEALVRRISPSVVQIVATGYEPTTENTRGQADVLIGRRRAIGSGVIVDAEGYIVTNAHVVNGAQQIEVLVPAPGTAAAPPEADARGQSYQARLVGVTREMDLAVLKIDAHGMPALPIRSSVQARQGEMVFAFGSPEGLRDTVTMGVVSSVARQPDPDSPRVYVQTDTPINPGDRRMPAGGCGRRAGGDQHFYSVHFGRQSGLGLCDSGRGAGLRVSPTAEVRPYSRAGNGRDSAVHHAGIGGRAAFTKRLWRDCVGCGAGGPGGYGGHENSRHYSERGRCGGGEPAAGEPQSLHACQRRARCGAVRREKEAGAAQVGEPVQIGGEAGYQDTGGVARRETRFRRVWPRASEASAWVTGSNGGLGG